MHIWDTSTGLFIGSQVTVKACWPIPFHVLFYSIDSSLGHKLNVCWVPFITFSMSSWGMTQLYYPNCLWKVLRKLFPKIVEDRGISEATLKSPEHTNHHLWFLNKRTKDYSISHWVVLRVQCDCKNSTARNRRDSLTAGSSGGYFSSFVDGSLSSLSSGTNASSPGSSLICYFHPLSHSSLWCHDT